MKTMKLAKKTIIEKWKWISWVGKGKSHSWKGVKERERDLFHLKSEPVKGNLGAGGEMDEQEMDQNKRHTSSSDIWLLFSFFQSSVNAQSKVLCDWASSHRRKHSSCLEGYSLWLRILTVFLAIKTIEGFGHKSSYWWGQPNFQCVSVCIGLCMSRCMVI